MHVVECTFAVLDEVGFGGIWIETSTKMYTPFEIGFSLQYGPYVHFGYWTLVSDP